MAKQSGIHQLKGKIRGMSYYRQKGVQDGLARSINQGMSKRVKEDAAYSNTRLNAAEFGTAGSFAGACIRAISDRQRTMLKDFATGQLAKAIRDIVISDTTNPWGLRQLVGSDWQEETLSRITSYAKIDFNSYVGGVWDTEVTTDGNDKVWTPNAELKAGWGQLLKDRGATHASIEMFAYKVSNNPQSIGSGKGFGQVALVASGVVEIAESTTFVNPATLSSAFDGVNGDNTLTGILVVVQPYQEVNSTKYIRQELCTFALFPVTQG